MKFDVVVTNPPFQDTTDRGKTQHKLWIDFTRLSFDSLLKEDGVLCQVSPSSFQSPSSKILQLFKDKKVTELHLDTEKYFPEVGSSFANYNIWNTSNDGSMTKIYTENGEFDIKLDDDVFYLPNDFCEESYSIHQKVIFNTKNKLKIEWDYVTCHNILLWSIIKLEDGKKSREKNLNSSLSKTKKGNHIHPLLHTNKQIWYSTERQSFADNKKVMWSRSGYTKPFYDAGKLGTTDMGYYIKVDTEDEGKNLAHNLNLKLFQYIFKTAKWSGFGNEKVFVALPMIPLDKKLTDEEMYDFFGLKNEERDYVRTN
jgi:hypothetical protein|tara:strand:- start:1243 stop:2178 length:936 start_codon:yes stop_codon:yes gene_type:complete